ncbi:MAG: Acyl carrier protein [Chloroflexi bacterium]|nr:MAG: Acyl carrier protein [Chloroflexota bacterium]
MTNEGSLNQQLAGAIAQALQLPEEQVVISSSVETLESWDSLAHLMVIMEVEQGFNVQFSTEEIPQLTSAKKLQDALRSRGLL